MTGATYRPSVTHPSLQRKPWVYYVRRDGIIKIGTTRNLARRMSDLQPEEILALERGSHRRETYRHRQFDRERLPPRANGETEWFEPSERLLRHIAGIADRNPRPTLPARWQIRTILEMENEPTPEETTTPIPPVRASLPSVQRRQEGKVYPSAREPRPVANLWSDGGLLSNAWPLGVVVWAIFIGFLAQLWSYWFIPFGLVVMILYAEHCRRELRRRGVARLQSRLDAEYDSAGPRREGLGTRYTEGGER